MTIRLAAGGTGRSGSGAGGSGRSGLEAALSGGAGGAAEDGTGMGRGLFCAVLGGAQQEGAGIPIYSDAGGDRQLFARDGKKGLPIIVYGVLTDSQGRPVAVEVYPGNTGDPSTVADQVETLRQRFGLERIVLVGDRGLLTRTQLNYLRQYPGLGWISALRSTEIRQLVDAGCLPLSLFDQQNLAEIRSPDFPQERLLACYNPLLAAERGRKRQELLAATEQELEKITQQVRRRRRTPLTEAEIALKVGRVLNRYKMAKHYTLTIAAGQFLWARNEESIQREAQLDGLYVIRTSEPEPAISAPDAVRHYKSLA